MVLKFRISNRSLEKVAELDSLTRDNVKWNEFVDKIKIYISKLKENLFEIMNTNNGYLDYLLNKESETKVYYENICSHKYTYELFWYFFMVQK